MLDHHFLAICQFAVWDIADLGESRLEMMGKGDVYDGLRQRKTYRSVLVLAMPLATTLWYRLSEIEIGLQNSC